MASVEYLGFLALLLAASALLPTKRTALVLGASLIFVGYQAGALVLGTLLVAGSLTWKLGAALAAEGKASRQLRLLWAGVALNLAPLILYKYVAFLPALGVSYFAFCSIAYLCDLYFHSGTPEPNLARHFLGGFFFPKFIQGPIERPAALQKQWDALGRPGYEELRLGAVLLVWGLFKKLVVAERLGSMVDPVFNAVAEHSAAERLWAVYLFAGQLFCDFSGYTDLALGSALVLGIKLTQNFDGPYVAVSMVDFWRRWHISLSTWIRDYVFEPLQMATRHAGLAGAAGSLFIAFFLMGVWHGATWGYAVFGLIHGTLMAGQLLWANGYKKLRKRFGGPKDPVPDVVGWLLTLHLVVFSFIYFRAASLGDAWLLLKSVPGGYEAWAALPADGWGKALSLGASTTDALVAGLGLLLVSLVYPLRKRLSWATLPAVLRWSLYTLLILATLFGGRFYAVKQFIYAQF